MPNRTLRSRTIDVEGDPTQFSESELDYQQQEQSECPTVESPNVDHEQDDSENFPHKADRTQTPADRHGEKEVFCEGGSDPVTVAEPVSIVSTNAQLQEILASVLQSVKQSVREGNEQLQRDIEQSVKGEISKLKEEVRLDNKSLIERFQTETCQLNKCFNDKLQHESAKMSKMVQEVRDENKRELVAVKKNIQALSKEFDDKLELLVLNTTELTSELGNQISIHKEAVDKQTNEMKDAIKNVQVEITNGVQTWQNEAGEKVENLNVELKKLEATNKTHLDQLNSEMNAIKVNLLASSTVGGNPTALPPTDNISTHTTESADNGNLHNRSENVAICQSIQSNCNECMHANVADSVNFPVNSVSPFAPGSSWNLTELSLPCFDDSSKVNAMFHLKGLDEYFILKGVPKRMQLAIALRSITDPTAKSWVAAVSHTLADYDQFKSAFAKVYWNQVAQSNVRRSIYQDKYNKQSGLSFSGHFLRYAVLASYLQPKMADVELINALMSHFALHIQRSYASIQINSIQEAINFLQRLEAIEGNDSYQGSNPVPKPQTQNYQRSQPYHGNSRPDNRNFVRQTYVSRPGQFIQQGRYWRGNAGDNSQIYSRQRESDRRSSSSNRQNLNPNAPAYSSQVTQNNGAEGVSNNTSNRGSEN
jgi:gas vesicle protein